MLLRITRLSGIASSGFLKPRWTPATLFASGEAGAWYDPSDLTTLFQDSAGTTAVTAVEQPVGLMLDKSRGLVLGAELVTNGDFASGANWVSNPVIGGWSFTDGRASRSLETYGSTLRQQIASVVVGKWYELSIEIISVSGSVFRFDALGTGSNWFLYSPGASGVKTVRVQAQTQYLDLSAYGNTACTLDNISVRELPGNHAFNSTALPNTVRPVLSARYNLLTYSEDQSNAAWTSFAATQVSNQYVAPDTTLTGDRIVEVTGSSLQSRFALAAGTGAATVTVSAYFLPVERTFAHLSFSGASAPNYFAATFELSGAGLVTKSAAGASGTLISASVEKVGNWYRCTIVGNANQAGTGYIYVGPSDSGAPSYGNFGTLLYSGNSANGVGVWGADLRVANDLLSNAYQRVVTATDYDADPTKFPYYLRFDGSDDWLQTASIDFSTVTSDGQPRRNLLSFPTAFNDAAWTKTGVTVVGVVTPPAGIPVAFEIAVTGTGILRQTPTVLATTHSASIYAKKKPGATDWVLLQLSESGAARRWWFNVGTGVIGSKTGLGTHSITDEGSGWYRCTVVFTTFAGTCLFDIAAVTADLGTTGDSAYIGAAQLETGSTATAFQNIGTDKMSVFAGVRKLSDAAQGVVVALGGVGSDIGSFEINAPYTVGTASYGAFLRGNSGFSGWRQTTFTAPITNTTSHLFNITGSGVDKLSARVNGASVASTWDTNNAGTGNFGNYALRMGSRSGTFLPFNGRLYSLIVRGALTDAGTIALAEDYVETKTFGKNMNIVYVDPITAADGTTDITMANGEDLYLTSAYQ